MKKNLLYLGLTGYLLFALCTRLQAQTDSLQAHRYVTRATMYGVGFTNVFDTYLSPQEYKGIDFRISRETIRMTKLFDGAPLSGQPAGDRAHVLTALRAILLRNFLTG